MCQMRNLLDVASDLLQTRGYASFSYRDISSRLGISKASVHHHFASKDELLAALTARYCARQKLRMAELDREYEAPSERLDASVALLQAGLDRTQALAEMRIAAAELDRAVGR